MTAPTPTGAWTLVAPLDGDTPARIDGAGIVTPHGVGWSVDWWIGADDRWYLPGAEPTVRQHRDGPGPVIRTSMRIPSGDAHHRVHGAVVDGRPVTVIEVENDSPVPVALALAVRPTAVDGGRPDGALTLGLASTVVTVDGHPAIRLPRQPNEAAASATTDLAAVVTGGGELRWGEAASDGSAVARPVTGSEANAVLLYPLPHRTSLRFVLSASPSTQAHPLPDVAGVPDHEAVARGWRSVIEGGARFEPADNGLGELLGAARARLLVGGPDTRSAPLLDLAPGAGLVLHALAVGGHRLEVEPLLDAVAETFPRRLPHGAMAAAEVVAALGPAHHLLADGQPVAPAPEVIEAAAQLTHLVEKADRKARGDGTAVALARRGLAALAAAGGDLDAARRLLDGLDPPPTVTLDELMVMAEAASEARSWGADEAAPAARFVLAARSLLLDDGAPSAVGGDGEAVDRLDELRLLPTFPSAWRGGNVEVHRAPTRFGEVSFGIRWHGARPALLWQLDRPEGAAPVRLACPGLDPEWSATDPRGETLLAGTAEGLAEVPGPGDGFR
ncbi:MAG: hypothetical protein AAGD35_08750 [Actinomycetota bacterium]